MEFDPAYRDLQQPPSPPRRENDWGLIIQHSAKEYDRIKSLEKQRELQRRNAYKQALDQTLHFKQMNKQDQKQEDYAYFNHMMQKNMRQQQHQKRKKQEQMAKIREIAGQNKRIVEENTRQQRSLEHGKSEHYTSILVGMKDGRKPPDKQAMLDFYQQHIQIKKQKEQEARVKDIQTIKVLEEREARMEQIRQQERNRMLSMKQNEDIFQYYHSLKEINSEKERLLQQKLVEQAARRQHQEEERRKETEAQKKNKLKDEMKQTLMSQIQRHHQQKEQIARMKQEERRRVDSTTARDDGSRTQPIAKQQYLEILLKQEEEAKRKRQEEKYMNALEFKMNYPDIKKAVNGEAGIASSSSPLYIGVNDEQQRRKDEIYLGLSRSRERKRESEGNNRSTLDSSRRSSTIGQHGYNLITGVYT